jgi:hypothetical protein
MADFKLVGRPKPTMVVTMTISLTSAQWARFGSAAVLGLLGGGAPPTAASRRDGCCCV